MPVLYLTENDVEQILTMEMALSAVEGAFRKLGLDEAENVPRQRCQTDLTMLHILPAAAKTLDALGFKAYTTSKEGARFHVTLYDSKKGNMIALMEADTLGQMRTGAATGLATKCMANPDAKTVGIYGTGKQARTQLLAICQVRSIERIHVYGRDAERRKKFAESMTTECQCEVIPVEQPEQAARDMAIVVTATTSREPVLFGEWLAEGTHVNLVGSNLMAKSESDTEVFRRAGTIAVDSKEQARCEAGDFAAPLRQHIIDWQRINYLSQIVIGRVPGRTSPSEITIYKSLGLGIEDIAVGVQILAAAKERGLGQELPIA